MYKLNNETDLNFLHNKEVEQICYGQYEVVINMSDNTVITMHTDVIVKSNDLIKSWIKDKDFSLNHLLGCCVKIYEIMSRNNLKITFNDLSEIILIDNESEFESYTITNNDTYIVV